MSIEIEKRALGAMCKSRKDYENVKQYIEEGAFSGIAEVFFKSVSDFYARDGAAESCPPKVVADRMGAETTNPKHAVAYSDFAQGIDVGVSVPNLLSDIRLLRRGKLGDKIAGMLANRIQSKELDGLLNEYIGYLDNAAELGSSSNGDSVLHAVGSKELVDSYFKSDATFQFPYPKLNRFCAGGARRGHHLLVFARPEIGKTLVALDIVGHLLPSHRVLYCGNEDPISDITLRLFQRLTGKTREDVLGAPGRFDALAFERGYANFIAASLSPGSFREIEHLVEEYGPDVVVLDQLRNIDVNDDNKVTGLEKAAIGARNLAKLYNLLIISVTQAGESAEGKSHLEMSDIDFSKTGIPGAIDLAIGIGASRDDAKHGFRTINISKNKLGGVHDAFQISVNTRTGTTEEV